MAGGVKVDFKMTYPKLDEKLKASRGEINLFVAANVQTNRGLLFAQGGARNGHQAWPAPQFRAGQPLKDRGTLSKSIGPSGARDRPITSPGGVVKLGTDTVTIGTNLKYAWLMNWGTTKLPGGVLTAKNAQALRIPLPSGKKATQSAKDLSKGASTKKDYMRKIADLEYEINGVRQPERRANLSKRLRSMKEKAAQMKDGEKYIFRKSVKIPARRFDEWTAEDQNEITKALTKKLVRILSR